VGKVEGGGVTTLVKGSKLLLGVRGDKCLPKKDTHDKSSLEDELLLGQ